MGEGCCSIDELLSLIAQPKNQSVMRTSEFSIGMLVLSLFIVLALGACESSQEKELEPEMAEDASADIASALEKQKSLLLDAVYEDYELTTEADSDSNKFVVLNPSAFPQVGSHNITIWLDGTTVWFDVLRVVSIKKRTYTTSSGRDSTYTAVDSVVSVEGDKFPVKLGENSVELRLTKKGQSFEALIAGAREFNFGSLEDFRMSDGADFKIVPNFNETGTTAFVGGQDTRGAVGRRVDYVFADLNFNGTFRKKIRVWSKGNTLFVAGNININKGVREETLNTCEVNFQHWDRLMDYNPLATRLCGGTEAKK